MKKALFSILILTVSIWPYSIHDGSFYSNYTNEAMEYRVIIPASYDSITTNGGKVPVVYMLHCLGGDLDYNINSHIDLLEMIDSYDFLIAMVYDGSGGKWWLDSPVRTYSQMSSVIGKEFPLLIDSVFVTLQSRDNRGLTGHSMGGYGSMHNLRNHPDVFSAAFSSKGMCDMMGSGAYYHLENLLGEYDTDSVEWHKRDLVTQADDFKDIDMSLKFYSGDLDIFGEENRDFSENLTAAGITHVHYDDNAEGHSPMGAHNVKIMLDFFDSTITKQPSVTRTGFRRLQPLHTTNTYAVALATFLPQTAQITFHLVNGRHVQYQGRAPISFTPVIYKH
ncbi:MAG: prolyl oligopeptidase family serine peptidase [Chitinivibrionales bacterium]|nr:prolyl oligopeptidase family serine peptidase [Chitinivibrionales bacterium]